jgi:hypothetical protein
LDQAISLLDREGECEAVLDAVVSHSRVLIHGSTEAGVPDFASWLAVQSFENCRLIPWDFESAPGLGGIDILRNLKRFLPESPNFDNELAAVTSEFSSMPDIQVVQSVAEQASAGGDQTIAAEIHLPNLNSYVRANINRLADATFNDIRIACEAEQIFLLFYGIRIGGNNPLPIEDLLNLLKSSMWRLAGECSPDRLCVAFAMTVDTPRTPDMQDPYFDCHLGPIASPEAMRILTKFVPGITSSQASAVIGSMAASGRGVEYHDLQKGVGNLLLSRLEPNGGSTSE